MSDMGDDFRALKEASQAKRAGNRHHSALALERAGIPFVTKNGGAHLIVDGRVDFWPGTGLWIQRGTQSRQRGVANLIRFIRATTTNREPHGITQTV